MNEKKPFFSQRHGYNSIKAMQVESMDSDLRNGLWNVYDKYCSLDDGTTDYIYQFYTEFLRLTSDEIPWCFPDEMRQDVKGFFMNFEWYEVYDFMKNVPWIPRAGARGGKGSL